MTAIVLTIWAAILVAGDTPIGRMLRTAFVERPAAWCAKIGRGHVALVLLLATIGATAIWAGGMDAMRMIGMATPDIAVWATTFEVATYLDVAVAVGLVASTMRLKVVIATLGDCIGRIRRTTRRQRNTPPRLRLPVNDEGDDRSLIAA